jgi:hypothetical protein
MISGLDLPETNSSRSPFTRASAARIPPPHRRSSSLQNLDEQTIRNILSRPRDEISLLESLPVPTSVTPLTVPHSNRPTVATAVSSPSSAPLSLTELFIGNQLQRGASAEIGMRRQAMPVGSNPEEQVQRSHPLADGQEVNTGNTRHNGGSDRRDAQTPRPMARPGGPLPTRTPNTHQTATSATSSHSRQFLTVAQIFQIHRPPLLKSQKSPKLDRNSPLSIFFHAGKSRMDACGTALFDLNKTLTDPII